MTYLLDTHALLFWLFGDKRLSRAARSLIERPDNSILVSSASGWEIATKYRLGKLEAARDLVTDIGAWVARAGFAELPVTIAHAQQAGLWPQAHRDPFDRLLAAQSALEPCPLITCDSELQAFPIQRAW